jgi:hypothetical protein
MKTVSIGIPFSVEKSGDVFIYPLGNLGQLSLTVVKTGQFEVLLSVVISGVHFKKQHGSIKMRKSNQRGLNRMFAWCDELPRIKFISRVDKTPYLRLTLAGV